MTTITFPFLTNNISMVFLQLILTAANITDFTSDSLTVSICQGMTAITAPRVLTSLEKSNILSALLANLIICTDN